MDADEELTRERIGKTLKGRYTLDALIGTGGMAAVYRGRHRNGNKVAVKVLHPDLAMIEDIRKRFLREGYVANKVDHRGAVRVLDDDVDEEDDSVFLVMELLEGETLEEYIARRGGTLPAREILPRVRQLLEVLVAAHDKGVVHRDLKPENVFLESEGGGIKILDFGIARLADGTNTTTHTGQVLGTPAYMAPEQARGETTRVGPATDLWAVGAIMFRAITGRVVYEAKAPAMSVVLAGTRPPPKIAELMPSLDVALAAVIDKTLDPVIEERWSSAAAMLAAIEKLEDNGPTTVSKTTAADTTIVDPLPRHESARPPPSPNAPTVAFKSSRPPALESASPPAVSAEPSPPIPRLPPLVPIVASAPPNAPPNAKEKSGRLAIVLVAVGAMVAGGLAFGAYAMFRPLPKRIPHVTPAQTSASVSASAAASASASMSTSAAASASASVSAEIVEPTVPPVRPPRPMGTVQIVTLPPNVRVTWNGAQLCEKTPCRKPIAAGEHTLRLQGADGATKTVTLLIRSNETTAKVVHMK